MYQIGSLNTAQYNAILEFYNNEDKVSDPEMINLINAQIISAATVKDLDDIQAALNGDKGILDKVSPENVVEFNTIIDGLRKTFHIAHIHGNNYSEINSKSNFPSSIEITFISKKLLKGVIKKSDMKYPIKGLDQPNRHSKPDINLSFS